MNDSIIKNGKIQNHCPVDLRPLPTVRVSSENEIKEAVIRARGAQQSWEILGLEHRSRLMKKAGKRMLERRQEVLELLHEEAGKTPPEILLSEAVGPLQYIQEWTKVIRPYLRTRKLPISALAFPGKSGVTEILPRGVVGIIAPWNYPLGNFFKPVFAALLCGNSVVIKPSEYSPRTAEWFVSLMNEFLPNGVLSLVQGDRDAGRNLIRSGIDALTFTGSYYSGKEVVRLAADEMIPCSIELGGKDAAIVLADCQLDRTVAGIMHWALHNAGQACGDIERVYVEESIADRFIHRLTSAVSFLRIGSGETLTSDLGPTVHSKQFAIIEDHVQDAIAHGAKLLCGGRPTGKGLWFEPTVLDHCNNRMKVMQEPTFGPVIPIVRVKNADEAVRLVNDCEYGLNASVWSQDVTRATQIAKRLHVGTAFINNHAFTGAMPAAPWTGVKKSGYGIANSQFALSHYTRPRTVVVDRKQSADAWWFPMDASAAELGQNLAEAQLGKIFAALKLPGLIARRQKRALQFVNGKKLENTNTDLPPPKRGLGRRVVSLLKFLAKHLIPPITNRELTWGQVTVEAIYSGGNSKALMLLPEQETRKFLSELYYDMPFPANFTTRFSFWVVGLSPLFKKRKWKTIEHISLHERLEILEDFVESPSYFQRQIVLLLKVYGSFQQTSTTRFLNSIQVVQPKLNINSETFTKAKPSPQHRMPIPAYSPSHNAEL